jgi:glycosyltransferase involved in cell wall biosynthesis
MRIITRMNIGGPALHVLVLSEGLQRRGYSQVLVSGVCETSAGEVEMTFPERHRLVLTRALSRSISPARDIAAIWSMYWRMRRERPDIVHTHTAKAGIIGRLAAWLARVPLIVHTFHGNSLSGYFSPIASRVFQAVERLLAKVTDRICVVSNQQLDELSGRFKVGSPEQFRVVPLGIDLSSEMAQPLPRMDTEVLTVGWLGRLVEIKGVPLLIAIVDEGARRGIPIRFLVAGGGPDENLIRACVARHGEERIRWFGWQSDVAAFLASCHVVLQTSRNEGTPVSLIQGMAAGRPFISTSAGGVVNMVSGPVLREAGRCRWFSNGVLAPPDPVAFVEALDEMRSAEMCVMTMGAAARAFALKTYRAERLVDDIDRLYRELLAQRSLERQGTNRRMFRRKVMGEPQCTF